MVLKKFEYGDVLYLQGRIPRYHSASSALEEGTDGWYFWDETWTMLSGPYKTFNEARDALQYYETQL